MATISSAAIASKLNRTPTIRFTTVFSSSSSVFFGDHINNQIGLRLAVDRPRRAHTSRKRGLSCNCLFGLGVPELENVVIRSGAKNPPKVTKNLNKKVINGSFGLLCGRIVQHYATLAYATTANFGLQY
ncbi:unnamed protein product [Fraxinus pennsylvanica]|uniref:Uncharacterized protein n=1 Tax=Fraxinus pennsylvanica TaxID=56036 RepID=A0AAD1ZYY0_9LAMI|nr:unnamed protein product [Fraxinus pennsylvanica]